MTRGRRGFLCLLGLSLLSTPARADDASDLEGLLNQTVVSTASKAAETGSTAPATSTTITAEDMQRYGIHSLDEAIDFLSMGVVTQNPLKAVDIGARGVLLANDSGDHFLLLINGHSINEPLFGAARYERGLGVPIEMIDHIEVVLGPGSVLYGSNAMLGVINVITKKAKDWKGFHAIAETEVLKSYRVTGGGATQFELFGKQGETTIGLEYYRQSGPPLRYELEYGGVDPITGKGTRYTRNGPENGYWGGVARHGYYSTVPAALVHLEWGDFELTVHGKTYKRAMPYRSRYQSDFVDFDDPESYELDRHLWGDLTYKKRFSPVVQLITRVYGDSWDWQARRNTSEASVCYAAGAVGAAPTTTCGWLGIGIGRWAGSEVRLALDWLENERLVTTLGVDGRLRTAGNKIDQFDYYTGKPLASSIAVVDRDDSVVGAYMQQTWTPARWLGFNGGIRLDKQTRFDGVFSPRLAANIGPWEGGNIRTMYAEAFRAPSIIEQDLANPIQLHAGTLKPERVRSIEASLEQRFGTQRIFFGAFRSWWYDLVELHLLSDVEYRAAVAAGQANILAYGLGQFRNVSTIDNYGFNAGYDGALGQDQQFKYGMTATATIARRNEPGFESEPLAVAPSAFGNARIAYDLPGALPTIGLAAHYLTKRPIDRAYDGGWFPPIYARPQLEARVTVLGHIPWIKGLSYRGSVDWLMSDHGPYAVGPIQSINSAWQIKSDHPELVPVDTLRATVGLMYDLEP